MDFTVDQVLSIIGRLDDRPGFDTPRERFRRLLRERMTTLESARLFIQQCREYGGEQSHRALQDAIVLAGRFLGFDASFGQYHHDPGAMPTHGTWLTRRRLRATVIVCTDQATAIDLDTVSRALLEGDGAAPHIAILVVTSFYAARDRLERSLAAGAHPNIRLVSLDGLLRLCDMVAGGRLAPDNVLQVLNPAITLDAQVDLLQRLATPSPSPQPAHEPTEAHPPRERDGRGYWVGVVKLDPFTSTERVVRSLITTHQIRINPAPGNDDRVRAGDAICVFVAGRGIVAHAQVAGILTDGRLRESAPFMHVLELANVTVYDAAVAPDQELTGKIELVPLSETAAVVVPISRREFDPIVSHGLSEAP